MKSKLGLIAMLGSGETSLAGGRIFESIARKIDQPLRVAILETPAGFELNSSQVAGQVGEFLSKRLQNYDLTVETVPARKRGTPFSPDEPEIQRMLLSANMIFMGPGSPTYAVRQLQGSLTWDLVRARHRQGAALIFASAAMIAVGKYALPVYEIYKAGEDVHAVPGLDLFADFGLKLSFIPHWNNTDGGEEVDTSRCFIGLERFNQWCDDLPDDHTTVGLDEHTGLIIDFNEGMGSVSGVSSATLLRDCDPKIYPSNAEFPLSELGEVHICGDESIRADAWNMLNEATGQLVPLKPPVQVMGLVEERQQARHNQDWERSDKLRRQIAAHGWTVIDTPAGPQLKLRSGDL
ncbi:MAG: hypothetical protein A2X25_10015 [Chloroflexi bacterium GWB2_49_20]|nr:MAG: hypothetical protein A2X25_10015 [Chloroflexi bacterium GWB2_49_20]OGN79244.1 MAG: hypothetical protein A2X26_04010 [Chloroflexi bacterium GWC2_49_37]OGN82986.1 MAG: hypothetical protein A2X27_08685 [Chloroflexi bacterium GWD2_49_16]HCC78643.1 cysteinyl-tRNA synthetase [Anaerolineae bacterium]